MNAVLVPEITQGHLIITGEEAHHLATVRRCRVGETIKALDGKGGVARCRVTSLHKREVELDVVDIVQHPPLRPHVILVQALSKSSSFETILQQSTELGVSEFIPVHTANCEVRLKPERHAAKQARWQKIMENALKQCGNPWLPVLHPVATWDTVWNTINVENILLADLAPGAIAIDQALHHQPKTVAICIGPEGDFTEAERHLASEQKAIPITLGTRVLRVETAAAAALSLIHHILK